MIVEALRPHCALPGEPPLSAPPVNIVDDDAAPELARDGGGEAPADRQNLIPVRNFEYEFLYSYCNCNKYKLFHMLLNVLELCK